ncbi:MAG: hypothetical protein HC794_00455 [Nitrospiraceae bacterium]|nr:hypothetical protein [Nitrospiraceae bacterium]
MMRKSRLRPLLAGSALAAAVSIGAYAHRLGPEDTVNKAEAALPCSSCDARQAAFVRQMEQRKEATE